YQPPPGNESARMTTGLHSWSRMVGDVKFHEHGKVDRSVGDRWKSEITEDFLGEPTWAMAEDLGFARRESGWLPLGPAGWSEGEGLPLSFAQERLWFLNAIDPESQAYNIPAALRLAGELSVPALRAALDGLVARHAALRTTFAIRDGRPVQIVHPAAAVALPEVDLAALPQAAETGSPDPRERELSRVILREAARVFRLEREAPLRALLVRREADDHVGLFAMHHIASDGWSAGILAREISAFYSAALESRPPDLPPLAVQYADYAIWQRRWLQVDAIERQLRYWVDRLAGAPAFLELPADRPHPPAQSFRGSSYGFVWPAELAGKLEAAAQRGQTTPFMLLLAGFDALLARLSGRADLSVGTPIAGRTRLETEALIGVFVNTLVLRVEADAGLSFRALVERVRETAVGAFAHQELPFEQLVDALQPERSLAWNPLFQVMFVLQNPRLGTLALPGLALSPFALAGEAAQFDLELGMGVEDGRVGGVLKIATDLFDGTTAVRWLGHFEALMAAAF